MLRQRHRRSVLWSFVEQKGLSAHGGGRDVTESLRGAGLGQLRILRIGLGVSRGGVVYGATFTLLMVCMVEDKESGE